MLNLRAASEFNILDHVLNKTRPEEQNQGRGQRWAAKRSTTRVATGERCDGLDWP